MLVRVLLAAVAAVLIFTSSSEARPRRAAVQECVFFCQQVAAEPARVKSRKRLARRGAYLAQRMPFGSPRVVLGGRPRAWCGWYMRQQVGSDPGVSYNLARNWARWGSNAGGPGVGVIVVWRHHVGKIVGQDGAGRWLVHSGNDGRAVRTRARSLAGVIAYRA